MFWTNVLYSERCIFHRFCTNYKYTHTRPQCSFSNCSRGIDGFCFIFRGMPGTSKSPFEISSLFRWELSVFAEKDRNITIFWHSRQMFTQLRWATYLALPIGTWESQRLQWANTADFFVVHETFTRYGLCICAWVCVRVCVSGNGMVEFVGVSHIHRRQCSNKWTFPYGENFSFSHFVKIGKHTHTRAHTQL